MSAVKVVQDVQVTTGGIFGALAFFFGGFDGLFLTLIIMMGVDWITGIMAAVNEKKLNSYKGMRGIFRKVTILLLVAVCHFVDVYIIAQGSAMRTVTAVFYIGNEGISILENAGRLGLPIPEKVRKILEQLKEENNNDKMG